MLMYWTLKIIQEIIISIHIFTTFVPQIQYQDSQI